MEERIIDHYGHHRMLFYLGAILMFGVPMATVALFDHVVGLSLSGIAFIFSGRKAQRAGQSMLTGFSIGPFWRNYGSTLDLDRMNPHQRSRHATVTGWAIVVAGVLLIAMDIALQLAALGVIPDL